ncbi:MAG TPA: purine-nucleoside phosphorylase [Ktedonobacterales bacterium]|jgi:purine-nucleoside phosphorylase
MTAPTGPAATPYQLAREAADALAPQLAATPQVAIVLGTGLGGLADRIEQGRAFDYAAIPHFPPTTVQGHTGQLVAGTLGGVPVAALRGRFHLYEGYTPAQVVHPVRTLALLGARTLIVTNAAGGLNPGFAAGDLMLLRDHIGLATLAGLNPLVGPNDERYGPRFPAMTAAYDEGLRAEARAVAAARGFTLREGVYVMVSGPTYETPAELRFLRGIGADAVGMSSVPEVIAGRHLGLRVLAVSCVTNLALVGAGQETPEPSHQEVVDTAVAAGARLAELIGGVLARLGASNAQPT